MPWENNQKLVLPNKETAEADELPFCFPIHFTPINFSVL